MNFILEDKREYRKIFFIKEEGHWVWQSGGILSQIMYSSKRNEALEGLTWGKERE